MVNEWFDGRIPAEMKKKRKMTASQLANIDQTTHGMSGTKTFRAWLSMKARCYNSRVNKFKNHGGRGIRVCERWRNDFVAFFSDMGECPQDLTLERIDNDGNYEPANCCWADWHQQARNRRDTFFLTMNGKRKCIADWADEYGIKKHTIRARIFIYNWSVKKAITTPTRKRKVS